MRPGLLWMSVAGVLACAAGAPGQTISLVRNINTSISPAPSLPKAPVRLGNFSYFIAFEPQGGWGLWRTDGTPAGTTLCFSVDLSATRAHAQSEYVSDLLLSGGAMYYFTSTGLWRTDGTPQGTSLVWAGTMRTAQGGAQQQPGRHAVATPTGVAFIAWDPTQSDYTLWTSDGTTAGTQRVADIRPSGGSDMNNLTAAGTSLFVTGFDGINARGLFVFEQGGGTAVRLFTAPTITMNEDLYLAPLGNELVFISSTRLYITDTEAQSATLLASFLSSPSEPVAFGGMVYFSGIEPATGRELWRTDGTPAGTQLYADLVPGTGSSIIYDSNIVASRPKVIGSRLYFAAALEAGPHEVVSVDGVTPGFTRHTNFTSGGTWVRGFTGAGDGVYVMRTATNTQGAALYRLDSANAEGAALVRSLWPGADPVGSNVFPFGDINGLLFFGNYTGVSLDFEPWVTNGTTITAQLKDIARQGGAGVVSKPTAFAGEVVFGGAAASASRIWRSAGELATTGTTFVTINDTGGVSVNGTSVTLGGLFFSTAYSGGTEPSTARDVWFAPDLVGPPRQLIRFDNAGANITFFPTVNGRVLFTAIGPAETDARLWASDGTLVGTRDLTSSPRASNIGAIVPLNDTVAIVFARDSTTNYPAIFRTDGTLEGTSLIAVTSNSTSDTVGPAAARLGDRVVYRLFRNGSRLGYTDGTPGGTVEGPSTNEAVYLSGSLVPFDGSLFFRSATGALPSLTYGLFRTDGVTTQLVTPRYPDTNEIVVAGGLLYFVHTTPAAGRELWATDGTDAGTRQVADIRPGALGSFPDLLTPVGDDLYFFADDGAHGRELWVTDGTPGGTRPVDDVVPGPGSPGASATSRPVASGGRLYTVLSVDTTGNELWSLVLPPACDPDFNADGNLDQGDVAYLIDVIAGGANPTGIDPDFTRDGNVDQADVDAAINAIAGGGCP